jgi:hypothetical protein
MKMSLTSEVHLLMHLWIEDTDQLCWPPSESLSGYTVFLLRRQPPYKERTPLLERQPPYKEGNLQTLPTPLIAGKCAIEVIVGLVRALTMYFMVLQWVQTSLCSPKGLCHAVSIRERLKKLLVRFKVKLVSCEGITGCTVFGLYVTFFLIPCLRWPRASSQSCCVWVLLQCCKATLHRLLQVIYWAQSVASPKLNAHQHTAGCEKVVVAVPVYAMTSPLFLVQPFHNIHSIQQSLV